MEKSKPDLTFISLGGGVQSSAMCLMAEDGIIPKPDYALFADTGWEPAYVYETIKALQERCSFPVETVSSSSTLRDVLTEISDGNLRTGQYHGNGTRARLDVPVYLGDNTVGSKKTMGNRQCTRLYKVEVLHKRVREILGIPVFRGKHHVHTQLGISLDEIFRVRDSRQKWNTNVYPLIDIRWRRSQCIEYLAANYSDIPIGKSSCIMCPFHSRREWLQLYESYPAEMEYAAAIEAKLNIMQEEGKIRYTTPGIYFHKNRMPLLEAIQHDIDSKKINPSLPGMDDDNWGNECSGHCGV